MLGKEIYLVQNFSEVKTKEKFVCIFPVSKEHSNSPLNVSIILINFYESLMRSNMHNKCQKYLCLPDP